MTSTLKVKLIYLIAFAYRSNNKNVTQKLTAVDYAKGSNFAHNLQGINQRTKGE
jgi:hypothetical protein